MKFCILSCAILSGTAQLAVANEEFRVHHAHDADSRVKGMVRPTKGKRNPLTAGIAMPKTATYEMEEGELRSLREKKGSKKRHTHSIFDDCETQRPTLPRGQTGDENDLVIKMPGKPKIRMKIVLMDGWRMTRHPRP